MLWNISLSMRRWGSVITRVSRHYRTNKIQIVSRCIIWFRCDPAPPGRRIRGPNSRLITVMWIDGVSLTTDCGQWCLHLTYLPVIHCLFVHSFILIWLVCSRNLCGWVRHSLIHLGSKSPRCIRSISFVCSFNLSKKAKIFY